MVSGTLSLHCLAVAWHVGLLLPRDVGVALSRDVGVALPRDVGAGIAMLGTCSWGPQSQSCCAVRSAPLGRGQGGAQPLCMSPAPCSCPGPPAGQAWCQGAAVMGWGLTGPLQGVGAGALGAQVLLRGVDP